MSDWRDICGWLPPDYTPVLVLIGRNHTPFQAMRDGDDWLYPILEAIPNKGFVRVWHSPDSHLLVTHWMPLPDKLEEEA